MKIFASWVRRCLNCRASHGTLACLHLQIVFLGQDGVHPQWPEELAKKLMSELTEREALAMIRQARAAMRQQIARESAA